MSPIIVTGMHRSGTSAVARLVQGLGFNLGSNLLGATESNRHGHFEEIGFLDFHDRLIGRHFPERAPFCDWLPVADGDSTPDDEERAQAHALWRSHCATGGVAWKDPRTSLFLDLWTGELPEAKLIVCLRHPYQVHVSLLRRGEPFLHTDYSAGIRGWAVYNRRIRRSLARLPADRFIVVDVESAFKDPALLTEELARFLGVPVPAGSTESIAPEEFHFEESLEGSLDAFAAFFPEIAALHRALRESEFDERDDAAFPVHPIRSEEARLIEFEEIAGLRKKCRRMLIRSIAVDRKRLSHLHRLSAEIQAEKDKLIQEMTALTEKLKQELSGRHGVEMDEGVRTPETATGPESSRA